ncbi:hypothetical protein [Tenacibaculum jejuense]|uniref:Lipoprotein n=1 Tax=Tenacibaculum jejuense TaxID=584609 RepID=A0A238UDK3_9FLAO|nr:hypothetical protein [Tenacibaculum jejuense]SNR17241.1 Protein of unknown function [Tenacibaculum jejuense]
MKTYQLTLFLICLYFLTSCKKDEYIQLKLPKENLEIHSFGLEQMGRKENKIILKNSKSYKELEKYISELDSLKTTESINFQPKYTIVSDSFKLSLNNEKLGIEYLTKEKKHIKLIKDIHYEEVFSLNFLGSEANEYKKYGDFYGIGRFKKDTYLFCGLAPDSVKYWYKKGDWKFLNKEKQLVAEGTFDVFTDTIKGHGGCFYPYKYSKIDTKKWKFYNGEQELTTPSLSLIYQLEKLKITD